MPRYMITRPVPGAGALSESDRRALSAKSNAILAELAPEVQWVTSYVVDDRIYCVYNAKDEGVIREHARRGGFPLTAVERVHAEMDPTTGEV